MFSSFLQRKEAVAVFRNISRPFLPGRWTNTGGVLHCLRGSRYNERPAESIYSKRRFSNRCMDLGSPYEQPASSLCCSIIVILLLYYYYYYVF